MNPSTQSPPRERALQAIAELTAVNGYSKSTVAQVTKRARISRTTFYEHFQDREECFLAAQRLLADELADSVERAIVNVPPDDVWPIALSAMIELANERPDAMRVLTHEVLGAGPRVQDQREELMVRIERAIEASWRQTTPQSTLDVPAAALIAAVLRLLSVRLRNGESDLTDLQNGLIEWSRCYAKSTATARWRRLEPYPGLAAEPAGAPALEPPHPPTRGRRQLPADQMARYQRQRIMYATAEVSFSLGYPNTTVADIVKAASLPREVFYQHFRDKQDACIALNELVLQSAIGLTAAAFFSVPDWPERVWESGRALTSFMANYPIFSHFGLVDANALGPAAIERIDGTLGSFTIFLEEGYRSCPGAQDLPDVTSEAIAAAIHEISTRFVRQRRTEELAGLLPVLANIILTTFIGPQATNELIDAQLRIDAQPREGVDGSGADRVDGSRADRDHVDLGHVPAGDSQLAGLARSRPRRHARVGDRDDLPAPR
jgi:AcrR family transcriptional regulator